MLQTSELVKVPSTDTAAVVAALSRQVRKLPTSLRRSLRRLKFFFFNQLSAFRNQPLVVRLAFSSRMYSIYAALGGWVQQAASRFQDRHVHGRQQRKSTGNATQRLPVPLRLQYRSQNNRPQLSVARLVQRFSRHGHVAAHAHPP